MKATIQSTNTKVGKEFLLSKIFAIFVIRVFLNLPLCNARVGESLPSFI